MKTNLKLRPNLLGLGVALTMIMLFGSCEKEAVSGQIDDISKMDSKVKAHGEEEEATGNNAFFPNSHQGFNHDIAPWGDMNSGEEEAGWCGEINLKSKKDNILKPSAGKGYATVMYGDCNTFWANGGFANGSAPATIDPSLWSQVWPESGFVHQLDIYLDPAYFEEGNAFLLYFGLYYDVLAYPFTYFGIAVDKEGNNLKINNEYEVSHAGWYTFKQAFDKKNDGTLTVDFELQNNHKTVYSAEMTKTVYDVLTNSYNIDEIYANGDIIGSGYMWFPYIASGVELPIDEYRLHPGK